MTGRCYSRQAQKDAKKLASSGLKPRAQRPLDVLAADPFGAPPRGEKPVGNLAGCYSRRINIQHHLVYEVVADRHVVHVLRMWTHYEQASSTKPCPRTRDRQTVPRQQWRQDTDGPGWRDPTRMSPPTRSLADANHIRSSRI